ncbi:MAG: 2-hydroxychromene-2-carboxylate isomerase [Alphaproteobacteria bacterium]|nr:2-hydroxychromene-2-carboxylate isomerase [Alphaproteobacteria bacterium]
MADAVTYYMTPASPYCYLGAERFTALRRRSDLAVAIKPVEGGLLLPATGGLPLAQRHPARKAYRLVELARWRRHLGMRRMNIEPAFFPVDDRLAGRCIVAAARLGHDALALGNALGACVWERQENVADPTVLRAAIGRVGLPGPQILAEAETPACQAAYAANTDKAVARGVFGVPWYVYRDEPFWGQDRLDFLERALIG